MKILFSECWIGKNEITLNIAFELFHSVLPIPAQPVPGKKEKIGIRNNCMALLMFEEDLLLVLVVLSMVIL
jgi:hypothetical protein